MKTSQGKKVSLFVTWAQYCYLGAWKKLIWVELEILDERLVFLATESQLGY